MLIKVFYEKIVFLEKIHLREKTNNEFQGCTKSGSYGLLGSRATRSDSVQPTRQLGSAADWFWFVDPGIKP